MRADGGAEALPAKKLRASVLRVRDAVRVKYKSVTRRQHEAKLVICGLVEHAHGKTGKRDFLAAAILKNQQLLLSGVRCAQNALRGLPRKKTHGHEAAFDAALANNLIELLQDLRRSQMLRSKTTQNSYSRGAIERGSASLSADVAEGDAKFSGAVGQKVVKVAAEFARGNDARGYVETVLASRHGRQ